MVDVANAMGPALSCGPIICLQGHIMLIRSTDCNWRLEGTAMESETKRAASNSPLLLLNGLVMSTIIICRQGYCCTC